MYLFSLLTLGVSGHAMHGLSQIQMQARADMTEIANMEDTLAHDVANLYMLFERAEKILTKPVKASEIPKPAAAAKPAVAAAVVPVIASAKVEESKAEASKPGVPVQATATPKMTVQASASEKLRAMMPPDVQEAYDHLNASEKKENEKKRNSVLDSIMTPAAMVPMLQSMYEKFKVDIKKANDQEQKSKERVDQQQKEYDEFEKEGKKYMLQQKQMVIDYYKRQRDIQHRHYHAMLKMAHAMMSRIKSVKGMCEAVSQGKKLNSKQLQELGRIAPKEIV